MSQCLPGMSCYQQPTSNGGSSNSCFNVYTYYANSDCGCQPTDDCLYSSDYVCYKGPNLPNTGINTDDSLTLALEKIDNYISESGQVPSSRELTINGTTYDLSADRTWSVGVVTSISSGTGISVGGTAAIPIITNTAPDQTVILNNGTGISISGTYPNFTIINSAPDQTVVLTQGSGVTITGTYPNFTISATGSGGTITSVGATAPLISSGGTTPTISTSMATNRLIGRYSAGAGIMQEITISTGLTLSGVGALSCTVSGLSGLTTNGILYATSSNTAATDSRLYWDPSDNILKIEDTAGVGEMWIHSNGVNVFIGQDSGLGGFAPGSGNSSTVCVGNSAGEALFFAVGNTLIGAGVGQSLDYGSYNTVLGAASLDNCPDCENNTLLGAKIMSAITTASNNNIVIGYDTAENLTGSNNIIIGYDIDPQSNSGDDQLVIQNAIFGSGNSAISNNISDGNIGFWSNSWGTNAAKVISIATGTAPTTSPADSFQFYSKDIVAGNAAPHFRTETGDVVKLYKYIDAAFGNTVNTGDAPTDALINALVAALTAHGLIATS